MVLIVNLNPAIDRIYTIDGFQLDKIHRTSNVLFQAGGKGINVARATRVLKGESILTGIYGGHAASFIKEDMQRAGIINDFSKMKSESRTCLVIVDKQGYTQTVINEDGCPFSDEDIEKFIKKFNKLIRKCSLLVLSGSLPVKASPEIYQTLIEIAAEQNIKAIVDTSKKPLISAIKGKPFIIKPNIYEFAEYIGNNDIANQAMNENFKPLISSAREVISNGVENVVISLGKLGAIYISRDKVYRVEAPEIKEINAVASGDSMTAALAQEIKNGNSIEESVISGVACGSANATIGGLRFTYELYQQLRKKVKAYYLEDI